MAQGGDCRSANFEIFTDRAVLRDVGSRFVAHAFINRALSSDCGLPRSFGPTTSFFQRPAMARIELPHFGGEFSLAQLMSRPLLQLGNIGGLFFGRSGALCAQLAPGHTHAAMTSGACFTS